MEVDKKHKSAWEKWNQLGGPKYPHEKIIQYTFRNFPQEQRALTKVLDAGCGNGVNALFLGIEGFEVEGVDIAEMAICRTRSAFETLNLKGVFYETSISELPQEDNSIDYLISVGAIDCVNEEVAIAAFQEFYRVLKPGGKMVLVFMEEGDFRENLDTEVYLRASNETFVKKHLVQFNWTTLHIDRYQTSYKQQTEWQKDFLITAEK